MVYCEGEGKEREVVVREGVLGVVWERMERERCLWFFCC